LPKVKTNIKIFLTILLIGLSIKNVYAQTKEETVAYISNLLTVHNNGSMYYSVEQSIGNTLSVNLKVYLGGTNNKTFHYVFEPKDALYLNSTTNSQGVTTMVASFRPKTVRVLDPDGKFMETSDKIDMYGLVDMSLVEIEKFKKAFKHLIKLFGGQIREDPF